MFARISLFAVVASLFFLTASATAQFQARPDLPELNKLHVLIVALTDDPSIGVGVNVDRVNMERLLSAIPSTRRSVTVLKGQQVLAKNILSYYNNLKVASNDAILFYYSGHGATSTTSHEIVTADDDLMTRSQVRATIRGKNAAFTVLMTDCCANLIGARSMSRNAATSRSYGAADWTRLKNLFYQHRGFVDVNAARIGTYAYGPDDIGGLFTASFATLAKSKSAGGDLDLNDDGMVDWLEIFPKLQADTLDKSQDLGEVQIPQFMQVANQHVDRSKNLDVAVINNLDTNISFRFASTSATVYSLETGMTNIYMTTYRSGSSKVIYVKFPGSSTYRKYTLPASATTVEFAESGGYYRVYYSSEFKFAVAP